MARCGRFYFGTNTKMSMTDSEALDYLRALRAETADIPAEEAKLFVIPSHTVLSRAREVLEGSAVALGAQNMSWELRGTLTGEISPLSLVELGVEIAELGHSERRHIFRETDAEIGSKVRTARTLGLTALLCVGETEEEKRDGAADAVLETQLLRGTAGLSAAEAAGLIVAYEPVWAIGAAGTPAPADYAAARHAALRRALVSRFGEAGADVPILYGGSVNAANAADYVRQANVNGVFVGRAAWTAAGYAALVRSLLPVFRAKEVR